MKSRKQLANEMAKKKAVAQQEQRKELRQLSTQMAPGKLETYLKIEGGKKVVKVEEVRRFKSVIPLNLVYQLQEYDPAIVLKAFFDKQGDKLVFRAGDRMKNKYLSLFVSLKHRPEVRVVKVNGRLAYRRGFAGSFYYRDPKGYAAIVDGTEVEIIEKQNLSPAELKKLEQQFQLSAQEKTKIMAHSKDIPGLSEEKEKRDSQIKYIMDMSRYQGLDTTAVFKMLKTRQYPRGFFTLTGRESFRTLVNWVVTFTATNIERFQAITDEKAYNSGSLTEDFLKFNTSGEMPARIRLRSDAYSRWVRASKQSYVKPTFIRPEAINAKSPEDVRKLRRAMVMHDVGCRKEAAESWNGDKTFESARGRLGGKYQIPSNGIFAGSHFLSSRGIEEMHGQNVTLDLFFHGTLGYARGRMNGVMRAFSGQNRVSVGVEDAFPASVHKGSDYRGRPYYSWRNLRSLPDDQQKQAISTYLSNVVSALEGRGLKVNEITASGHSCGGIMLHHLAKLFPSGEVPISTQKGGKRILRIKGFFAADSHYFQNTEFFNSYLAPKFRESLLKDNRVKELMREISELTGKIKNSTDAAEKKRMEVKRRNLAFGLRARVMQLCENIRQNLVRQMNDVPASNKGRKAYTLREIVDSAAKQLADVVFKKALNGSLQRWQPPKYFGTGLRDWWSHQERFHQLAQRVSGHGSNIKYQYKGSVTGHGQAFRDFVTRALQHFEA